MGVRWTIERAMEEAAPPVHPLMGCSPENFQAHISEHGGFTSRTDAQRKNCRLAVKVRQPFILMENLFFSRKVEKYELPHPPVFLIGHWRSGTTHLHNLMSSAQQFSTIDFGQTAMPHNLLNPTRFIGRAMMASTLPKDRGMDRVKMGIKEPQEEEMALGNLNPISYYNVFYYPQEMKEQFDRAIFLEGLSEQEIELFEYSYIKLLKKLSIVGKGKQLLLKNPASTARIEMLDKLFPGVRFVHIVRNPYEVFASMLHHYPRLFHAFAWQKFDDVDLEEMVLYKYSRLMEGYLERKEKLGDRILETTYEQVIQDPLGEIGRLYDELQLSGKDEALSHVKNYVEARNGYRRNQYRLTQSQVDRIRKNWGFALNEWNYDVPDSIEVI